MDSDRNLINLIVGLIVVLGSIAGALAQAWRRIRKTGTEEEAAAEPEPDLEGDGGELPARPAPRRGIQKPRARAEPIVEIDDGKPEVPAEGPIPPAGAEPVPGPTSEPARGRPRLTLDERLFTNHRLTFGARLVLAKEILDRPPCLRRRRKSTPG